MSNIVKPKAFKKYRRDRERKLLRQRRFDLWRSLVRMFCGCVSRPAAMTRAANDNRRKG